jgi:DNA-binding MarR family transcriptional regulator
MKLQERLLTPARRVRTHSVVAWLRLARVYQQIDHVSARHMRRWGLSVPQFDVLVQIGHAEGMTQQQLADSLLVTKGNVCQLLGRMEQLGLLIREQDGRANRLRLSAKGRQLFDEIVPAQEALIAQQFAGLDHDEQRELVRLLGKLDHGVGSNRPDQKSA